MLWNFHLGKFVSFSLQVFQRWKDPQAFLLTFKEYCNSNLTVMTSPLHLRILCQCRKLKDGYSWYFYSEMFYVAKGGMTRWKIIFLFNFVILQWFSLFMFFLFIFFFIWFVRFGEGSNILAPFILLASPLPYNYHFYLVIRLKNVIICLKVRFSNSIQTVTATYFIQHISQCCWCTVSLRICIKKWLSEKLLLSPA